MGKILCTVLVGFLFPLCVYSQTLNTSYNLPRSGDKLMKCQITTIQPNKGGVREDGAEITPNDAPEIMQLLKDLWATGDTQKVTEGVLAATSIWGEDLNNIPGLTAAVKANLDSIQEKGMLETVKGIL